MAIQQTRVRCNGSRWKTSGLAFHHNGLTPSENDRRSLASGWRPAGSEMHTEKDKPKALHVRQANREERWGAAGQANRKSACLPVMGRQTYAAPFMASELDESKLEVKQTTAIGVGRLPGRLATADRPGQPSGLNLNPTIDY